MTEETQSSPVVSLTPKAAEKIKSLVSNDPQATGKSLRIYLEAGGCSGYQYGFTYDELKSGDEVISSDGISVIIDPESAQLLKGSVIDYKEEFGSEGFAVENPNVKKSCGCGHSVEI